MVSSIAEENGNVFIYESNTPGGYTFNGHTTNATSLALLAQSGWDYLVLQEQSQLPSFSQGQVATECYPYAETLCEVARESNPCVMPLFFMTWGRENGDASNCEFWPPICTYEGMQEQLTMSYINMAEMNQGMAAPAGDVWRNLRADHPEIDLYSSDGSHPSQAGTYVVSATMYAVMFSELGTWTPAGFDAAWAAAINEEITNLVFNSEAMYFLDRELSAVGDLSNYYIEAQTLNLQPETSTHVESMNVSVDGELIATEVDLLFGIDFSDWLPGPYTISAEFNSPCGQGFDEFVFVVGLSVDENSSFEIAVYPNPANEVVNLSSSESISAFTLSNTSGQIVLQEKEMHSIASIDVRQLPTGIYTLELITKKGKVTKRVVLDD